MSRFCLRVLGLCGAESCNGFRWFPPDGSAGDTATPQQYELVYKTKSRVWTTALYVDAST